MDCSARRREEEGNSSSGYGHTEQIFHHIDISFQKVGNQRMQNNVKESKKDGLLSPASVNRLQS
jgi:hypothetical protein